MFAKEIHIDSRKVGSGCQPYVIFEVANTHQDDWGLAENYGRQAKDAGADAIKFQLFTADGLLNPISSMLQPTYDYFKTAETPREWFPRLKKLCEAEGIDLLCTPFDEDAATFLNDEIGLPAVKIAPGDMTNHKLLKAFAKFGKPVILSTGVATMEEVEQSVNVLRNAGCEQLAVLQCVAVYPMPYEAANIRVMQTYEDKFGSIVGYSDNGSKGILVPLVAVALGASIIEKHVTSQKQRANMDDIFSLSVEEFGEMVERIRQNPDLEGLRREFGGDIDIILGSPIKAPSDAAIEPQGEITKMDEWRERRLVRRGLYPKVNIPAGTKITDDMLIALRPDVGVSSMQYEDVLGGVAQENLPAKHPIKLKDGEVRLFHKADLATTYAHPKEQETVTALVQTVNFD